MDQVQQFIENANKRSELQRSDRLNAEKVRVAEINKLRDNLSSIADETNNTRETIDKNLSSIASYKHIIKRAGESVNEPGLPISNANHGKFIDLVSKAMTFANVVGDNTNSENNADEFELITAMQVCNENMMQQIRKDKNMIEDVESVIQNTQILKESNPPPPPPPVFEEGGSYLESSMMDDIDV